jgi:RNA polymerase sigma-70 factor, ECF subfamily
VVPLEAGTSPKSEDAAIEGSSQTPFPQLLAEARCGSERAWTQLYRSLAPEVLGFLRGSRVPDPEDVLGAVFLDVARAIGSFDGDERGFRAWVFTIARSRLVDDARRRARRREESVPPEVLVRGGPHITTEHEVIATIELDRLLGVLDTLTGAQREVVLLRVFGELTAPEVARVVGKSIGAVEQLYHRAITSLRRALARKD